MDTWKIALREGAVAGTVATVVSTALLAVIGQRENASAVAPVNAVSHWLWGDESLHADGADLRHTLTGFVTHHLAAVFWASLYSLLHGHRDRAKTPVQAVAGGIATSAVAYAVDYHVVPQRLTPGWEHRMGPRSLALTYGSLAVGFALGALLLGALGRRSPDAEL
jgi:hypothetical protein